VSYTVGEAEVHRVRFGGFARQAAHHMQKGNLQAGGRQFVRPVTDKPSPGKTRHVIMPAEPSKHGLAILTSVAFCSFLTPVNGDHPAGGVKAI